ADPVEAERVRDHGGGGQAGAGRAVPRRRGDVLAADRDGRGVGSSPDGGTVPGEEVSEHDGREGDDDEHRRKQGAAGGLVRYPATGLMACGWLQLLLGLAALHLSFGIALATFSRQQRIG